MGCLEKNDILTRVHLLLSGECVFYTVKLLLVYGDL